MPAAKSDTAVPWGRYPQLRLLLVIMERHFSAWSGAERLKVFNSMAKTQLGRDIGLTNGIASADHLMSQLRESRKEKNTDKWEPIREALEDSPENDEANMAYDRLYGAVKTIGENMGLAAPTERNGSDAEDWDEEEDEELGISLVPEKNTAGTMAKSGGVIETNAGSGKGRIRFVWVGKETSLEEEEEVSEEEENEEASIGDGEKEGNAEN